VVDGRRFSLTTASITTQQKNKAEYPLLKIHKHSAPNRRRAADEEATIVEDAQLAK